MESLQAIGDSALLVRTQQLVRRERAASVDVIEHLMEIERRGLYLNQACSSLYSYCRERLGFSEDEALKRVRVARLAVRRPEVLLELRGGAVHLTGLFVLASYAEAPNFETLLAESRNQSRARIEQVLARHFPCADTPARIREQRSRLEPLSESRYRVEFTASAEFRAKLERAQELLSHTIASGDLEALFERALDHLLEQETGAGSGHQARERRRARGYERRRASGCARTKRPRRKKVVVVRGGHLRPARAMCRSRSLAPSGNAMAISARSPMSKDVAAANGAF